MKKKKIIIVPLIVILLFGIGSVLVHFNRNEMEEPNMIIRIGGWDMEYVISDRELTVEDFENIQLGSSLDNIESVLGEPDGWVGFGTLLPTYILQDNSAVVLVFDIEDTYENLVMISLYKDEKRLELKKRQ